MLKFSVTILTLFFTGYALLASAQDVGTASSSINLNISSDNLDYYLLQAFAAEQPQKRLRLNHIGLTAIQDETGFIVSSLLDGYPAHVAGLRSGDRLEKVNGIPFHPLWSFNSQEDMTDGFIPNRTAHRIEFDRNGTQQSISIVPVFENLYDSYRSATLNSAQEINSGNKVIGYLKLWSVSRSTNDLISFKRVIDSLSHCDGLILDLRDSYGFINAEHLDRFFPSRNSYFDLTSAISGVWSAGTTSRLSDDYYGKAIVVIQNKGTRGGMELFGYQLSKLQRAISLGENTEGRLGNITVDNLNNEVSYQADAYTTVDGLLIESVGLAPEQRVAFSLDESRAVDPQLEAAVSTLLTIM